MKYFFKNIILLGFFFVLTSGIANSQVVEKTSLSLNGAKQVMEGAKSYLIENQIPGAAIAIVDEVGHLILVERFDGTFSGSADISIGKARTAAMTKRSTKTLEDQIKKSSASKDSLPDFTMLRGGIPIIVNGHVLGGIGVAGSGSIQQDEDIAFAGAESIVSLPSNFLIEDTNASESSTRKGSLINSNFGRNYAVYRNLRPEVDESEIHGVDTEIIYIVQGKATLVIGGTSINLKQIETNEFRGSGIENGVTHNLEKGDIIIVPKDSPHWFKNANESFLFHVVKIR